jgi:hypothetical protein
MKSIIPPRLEAVIRARLGVSALPPEDALSRAGGRDPSDIRGASYHARRVGKNLADVPCIMLSETEIARALRRYRFDRQFRGPSRIPIKTLADFVGLSHETLFQAMRGKISDVTRAKLSWAIVAIAEGRLRFHRRGQVWQIETTSPILPSSTVEMRC